MNNFLSALIILSFGFVIGYVVGSFKENTYETTKRLEPASIKITNLDGKVDTTYIYNLKKY